MLPDLQSVKGRLVFFCIDAVITQVRSKAVIPRKVLMCTEIKEIMMTGLQYSVDRGNRWKANGGGRETPVLISIIWRIDSGVMVHYPPD